MLAQLGRDCVGLVLAKLPARHRAGFLHVSQGVALLAAASALDMLLEDPFLLTEADRKAQIEWCKAGLRVLMRRSDAVLQQGWAPEVVRLFHGEMMDPIRTPASRLVVALGAEHVFAVVFAYKFSDVDGATNIVHFAGKLSAELAPRFVQVLQESDDPRARSRAAGALGCMSPLPFEQALEDALSDVSEVVRQSALYALTEPFKQRLTWIEAHADLLVRELSDDDHLVPLRCAPEEATPTFPSSASRSCHRQR
mmetsp:Transcript_24022/g.77112  ORF Transcript_24022/g.77112 Transcript_24022/m.77112 type:complete len:253 (-) Transcript_24022:6-764(-)